MLDPWIIDEIRRREQERTSERRRESVQIPLIEHPPNEERDERAPEQEGERGVIVIDL